MKTVIFAATAAVALLASTSAGAVAINLYNTGVDAGGTAYTSDGNAELHYLVNGTSTAVTYKHPAWIGATDAYWIAAGAGGAYAVNPNVYTLTFSLTGLDAATAAIAGGFAADDGATVQLNGGTAIGTVAAFGALTSFSFNSGFTTGLNTLTFTVTDTGGVPSGLLVSGLSGNADVGAVPEPATWSMMLIGFGGMGYAMRRRKVAFAA